MPGSISPEEVDEKYYDWVRAAKSIEKARYDLEVNKEKVKVSLARQRHDGPNTEPQAALAHRRIY